MTGGYLGNSDQSGQLGSHRLRIPSVNPLLAILSVLFRSPGSMLAAAPIKCVEDRQSILSPGPVGQFDWNVGLEVSQGRKVIISM